MECYICHEVVDFSISRDELIECKGHHAHTECTFTWLRLDDYSNTTNLDFVLCQYCRVGLPMEQVMKIKVFRKSKITRLENAINDCDIKTIRILAPEISDQYFLSSTLKRIIEDFEPKALAEVEPELVKFVTDEKLHKIVIEHFLSPTPRRFAWIVGDLNLEASFQSVGSIEINERLVKLVRHSADKRRIFWVYKEIFPQLRFDNKFNIGRYLVNALRRKEWTPNPKYIYAENELAIFLEVKEKHHTLRCFVMSKLVPLIFLHDSTEISPLNGMGLAIVGSISSPCVFCRKRHVLDALDLALKHENEVFLRSLLRAWYYRDHRSLASINWTELLTKYPNSEKLGDIVFLCIQPTELETRKRYNMWMKAQDKWEKEQRRCSSGNGVKNWRRLLAGIGSPFFLL